MDRPALAMPLGGCNATCQADDDGRGPWRWANDVSMNRRSGHHNTADVLNAPPISVHGEAEKDVHAIYQAENRAAAEAAFDRFTGKYGARSTTRR